jgi:hypothetical protein
VAPINLTNMAAEWPTKTREIHNHHFDSTIWNEFDFRDDDIVIATYAKCESVRNASLLVHSLCRASLNEQKSKCRCVQWFRCV